MITKTLKMKRNLLLMYCLCAFIGAHAQSTAFLVPNRIEVELLKDEISNLNTKDINYKSKLAALQTQQYQSELKAVEFETLISTAVNEESKTTKSQFSFKTKTGAVVFWSKTSNYSATGVPIKPPGGRPCQPGACLTFLLFATEECPSCDFSNFVKIREFAYQNKKYAIYKASASGTIVMEKYKIVNFQYARR